MLLSIHRIFSVSYELDRWHVLIQDCSRLANTRETPTKVSCIEHWSIEHGEGEKLILQTLLFYKKLLCIWSTPHCVKDEWHNKLRNRVILIVKGKKKEFVVLLWFDFEWLVDKSILFIFRLECRPFAWSLDKQPIFSLEFCHFTVFQTMNQDNIFSNRLMFQHFCEWETFIPSSSSPEEEGFVRDILNSISD